MMVILPIFFGQYRNFLFEVSPYLLEKDNWITQFFFSHLLFFQLLRWISVAGAIIFALGIRILHSGLVTAIAFSLLDYLSYSIESEAWSFMTHIQFFIFFLSFSGRDRRDINSFIFRVMQVYICMLYFQAGLSKVIHGGLEWPKSGDTIFVMTYFHETFLGKVILPYKEIFIFFSIFAVAFELLVPLFFILSKNRTFFGVSLVVFHLCIYCVFGISFWQLFILYPILFKNEKRHCMATFEKMRTMPLLRPLI